MIFHCRFIPESCGCEPLGLETLSLPVRLPSNGSADMQEPDHFAKLPILPGGCIKANDPQIQRPVRRTTQGVPHSLRDWVQIPRGLFTRRSPTGHTLIALFLLLAMESVLPQTRAILFDAKFLSAGLSPDGIVVVAALFTHEKNRFSFLLTSGHREGSVCRLIWAI